MPVKITKKPNFGGLGAQKISKAQKEFRKAAADHVSTIDINTSHGRRFDGTSLPNYKPSTVKSYEARGLETGFMDLRLTGNMMQSLQHKVTSSGNSMFIKIFFAATASFSRGASKRTSAIDKARVNQRRFNFFGISDEQKQEIVKRIKERIK